MHGSNKGVVLHNIHPCLIRAFLGSNELIDSCNSFLKNVNGMQWLFVLYVGD